MVIMGVGSRGERVAVMAVAVRPRRNGRPYMGMVTVTTTTRTPPSFVMTM